MADEELQYLWKSANSPANVWALDAPADDVAAGCGRRLLLVAQRWEQQGGAEESLPQAAALAHQEACGLWQLLCSALDADLDARLRSDAC